jgi:sulfofructose kinase
MSEPSAMVFAGMLTWDAIALVDTFPDPDSRQVARDLVHAGGGPAATAAVAASRLGVRAAIIGSVGADDEGDRVRASLRDEGVDVSGVRVVPRQRSGASVVVADAARGTRAIATRPVPPLTIDEAAAAVLGQAEWVHVDHHGWGPVREHLARVAPDRRPRLSVDGGNPIDRLVLDGVDLYVPTVKALSARYGELDIDDLLGAALADGAHMVVATDGARGSFAMTADGTRYSAPGLVIDVVSTLGAGDVFHGALLAALHGGMPVPRSLRYANVAAALSCRGVDGRSAIPTSADVESVLAAQTATSLSDHDPVPVEETR